MLLTIIPSKYKKQVLDWTWGEVTYTWADDNSTCTATRVYAHDATHVDTETVDSTYKVVEEAKCEEDGKGRYTADFTKEARINVSNA